MLVGAFRDAAADADVMVAALHEGRTTEARLRVQAEPLATALSDLAGPSGQVWTEETLYDHDNRLWGTVDLLVYDGRQWSVLDLKTGADAAANMLPSEIENQLLLYAQLVKASKGELPRTSAVFSLRRGIVKVTVDALAVRQCVTTILAARAAWTRGERPARPELTKCKYCRRRLDCEPHWSALETWDDSDGVQGVLVRHELSQSGRTSVLLQRDQCQAWVYDLAGSPPGLNTGQVTRAIRVRRRDQDPDLTATIERWRANEGTIIRSQFK